MNHFTKITIFVIILLAFACSGTYRVVDFEVLEPAEITFPEDVRQLLVLNRLRPGSISLDSSISSMINKYSQAGLDTLVAHNIFRGLFGALKESPFESFHWPIWVAERWLDLPATKDSLLSQRLVADLCEQNYSDAILSLESVQLDIEFLGYAFVWDTYNLPSYAPKIKARWLIYLPENPGPYNEYMIENKIFRHPFSKQLEYTWMIIDVASESGQHFGQKITPVWTSETRNIFAGSPAELRRGGRETRSGDWDEAFQYWSNLSVSGDSSEKAKAMFNMAVYYELEDELDSSLFLLDRAIILDTLIQIREYHKDINSRIQKKRDISRQVENKRL